MGDSQDFASSLCTTLRHKSLLRTGLWDVLLKYNGHGAASMFPSYVYIFHKQRTQKMAVRDSAGCTFRKIIQLWNMAHILTTIE
jgi:hypothetical protein